MLPLLNVREYLDEAGRSPYGIWFDSLNAPTAAKVTAAIIRMSQGKE
jgi:uncharacterized protein YqjF (DUF2071 family)